jgi:hypothetical protein
MLPDVQSQLNTISQVVQEHFWVRPDFWIATIIGIAGLVVGAFGLFYAVQAFREAEKAKLEAERATRAAMEAGKTVKAQTVAVELGEVSQKLEKLQPGVKFQDARDLLMEISKRLRRNVSPFAEDEALEKTITTLRQALDTAQKSLNSVRPAIPANEEEAPNAVFNGVESDFATIGNLVADLLGLFEKQTFDSGVGHGKS